MKHLDTVIVGGGQAGLATSYYLKQYGCDHVVLEQAAQPSPMWRNRVWDSFTLVTPNWAFKMPGAEYDGAARDGYMARDEVVAFFEEYIDRYDIPIQFNTRVQVVDAMDGAVDGAGYRVRTPEQTYEASNVVMATGWCQQPKIPPYAKEVAADITQIHSSEYRNAASLPAGAVLVVGSGQSGCQIAEELHEQGRRVFLSTGSAGRAPRRYRGKDLFDWLNRVGFFDLPVEQLPPGSGKFSGIPHISGRDGGRTLNLHQFARDGITLLGHMRNAQGDRAKFAPDLYENLTKADKFAEQAMKMIDGYIQANGVDAPEEEAVRLRDGFEQPVIDQLDLHTEGITTVIWATGYTVDFSLVKLPIRDEDGLPIQSQGVSNAPGLYFVGLPWSPTQKPAILLGVGESAQQVAAKIIQGEPEMAHEPRNGA